MSKVVKIVTDSGSNFVCAFKTTEENVESEVLDSNGTNVVSLRDILNSYNGTEYPIRPHQRCASHRFNNIMHADIESARKKVNLAYNNDEIDEHATLGRQFFDSYDAVLKDCNKLWGKQQRSTVGILLIFVLSIYLT